MAKILVIDDEEYIGWVIKKAFEGTDNEIHLALNGKEGIKEFHSRDFDLVFLDLRLPDMDGMDILSKLKMLKPDILVIIITAHGSIDTAIESMKKGAFDYITKPFDVNELLIQAQKAAEISSLREEVNYLRNEAVKEEINDSLLLSNEEKLKAIAESSANVLIIGESGTGKETAARRIHRLSTRHRYPFISINCCAVSDSEIENELFGYENETFSGNRQRTTGKFELAGKGTIFIDEIGELSLSLQVRLLRVLEEKEFQRVGGSKKIKFEARVVTATNKNLLDCINNDEFREDLYYRLNVLQLELLPLRERKEDISDLINFFLKKYDLNEKIREIKPDAIKLLKSYHWPGNIRELENVIERIVILSTEPVIRYFDLPIEIINQKKSPKEPIIYFPEEGISLENVEKQLILKALKMCEQNQSRAAQFLDITRSALIYRMQKYKIN